MERIFKLNWQENLVEVKKFQMRLYTEVDPIVSMEIVIMGLCCLKKTPYKMSKLQREKKNNNRPLSIRQVFWALHLQDH